MLLCSAVNDDLTQFDIRISSLTSVVVYISVGIYILEYSRWCNNGTPCLCRGLNFGEEIEGGEVVA